MLRFTLLDAQAMVKEFDLTKSLPRHDFRAIESEIDLVRASIQASVAKKDGDQADASVRDLELLKGELFKAKEVVGDLYSLVDDWDKKIKPSDPNLWINTTKRPRFSFSFYDYFAWEKVVESANSILHLITPPPPPPPPAVAQVIVPPAAQAAAQVNVPPPAENAAAPPPPPLGNAGAPPAPVALPLCTPHKVLAGRPAKASTTPRAAKTAFGTVTLKAGTDALKKPWRWGGVPYGPMNPEGGIAGFQLLRGWLKCTLGCNADVGWNVTGAKHHYTSQQHQDKLKWRKNNPTLADTARNQQKRKTGPELQKSLLTRSVKGRTISPKGQLQRMAFVRMLADSNMTVSQAIDARENMEDMFTESLDLPAQLSEVAAVMWEELVEEQHKELVGILDDCFPQFAIITDGSTKFGSCEAASIRVVDHAYNIRQLLLDIKFLSRSANGEILASFIR